jgi:hypothetical protein
MIQELIQTALHLEGINTLKEIEALKELKPLIAPTCVFLILLALNSIATALLVGAQMLIGKLSPTKATPDD